MLNEIAIIDLGGQYCHLIARRLRDIGVDSEIFGPDVKSTSLTHYRGVVLSGGPDSVYDTGAPRVDEGIITLGIPVLGICYGHQLLAQILGGRVERRGGEYGSARLTLRNEDTIFRGTPAEQTVWMSHSDAVVSLPTGSTSMASTVRCEHAAFADLQKGLFGIQFHPEVVHTQHGTEILRNFVRAVCGIREQHAVADRVPFLIEQIRARVEKKSVFFLVSGGVDSTVAFVLCARALPKERILGLYVDTGLMRKGEKEELQENLASLGLLEQLRIADELLDSSLHLRVWLNPNRRERSSVASLWISRGRRCNAIDRQRLTGCSVGERSTRTPSSREAARVAPR